MSEDPISQRARSLFGEGGFYCAESVLIALAERQGIESELIPRLATGFCSGMARSGGQCGAVSGAVMGIGLALGRSLPNQPVDAAYAATQEFLQAFQERFGSINCQSLTSCHLGTPEGQARFRAEGKLAGCQEFAAQAARLAQEIIESHSQTGNA